MALPARRWPPLQNSASLVLAALLPLSSLAAACGGVDPAPADTKATGVVLEHELEWAPIDSPAGPGSGEPWLSPGIDGDLWMSWLEPAPDGRHALRVARLARSTWDEPRTVVERDDLFVNWADFPSVIALADGRLVAHWLQRSGDGPYAYDVVLSISRDGGVQWDEPFRPHEDGTQTEHGFVSLVPEPDGGFTAVWLDGRETATRSDAGPSDGDAHAAGAMTLRSRRYGADGVPGDERLLDPRICDCCQTSAVRVGNEIVAAYRDRSDDEVRDIAFVRRDDSGWSAPAPAADDSWQIPGCPVNGPSLSADGERVAIAWFALVNGLPEVKVAFGEGRGFGEPLLIERTDGSETGAEKAATLGRVDVEWIAQDKALVTWLSSVGQSGEIRYRIARTDGALGDVRILAATSPSRASGFPRLTRTAEGLFAAWTLPGEPATVHVARLDLSGFSETD